MIIKTNDYTPTFIESAKGDGVTVFNDFVKLDRGNLICIAARPGMGKTSLALHMALEFAKKSNKNVYIFSLEMSAEQIKKRLIAQLSAVPSEVIYCNSSCIEQTTAMRKAEEDLKKINIVIDDTVGISVKELKEKLDNKQNIGLVVIDYLQLMSSLDSFESRAHELSKISRDLKALSKEFRIPILVTTQLSRSIWLTKKRPELGDLRDYGAICQDMDTVIFIHREGYSLDDIRQGNFPVVTKNEIIIAKNRYDKVETIIMEWHGKYGRFSEVNKEG